MKKKILLIGDSIRMGYDKYVKEALSDTADVYYPNENCRFAEYVLRYAHTWKSELDCPDDIDLVHWNAGLWDALELFGEEPLSTLEFYEYTIKRIDKRLRFLFPNAKIIFATSTAVIEEMASPDFFRHNETIKKYNAAAIRALSETDTVINDLWNITEAAPRSYHSDWVHYYTDEGTELIGGKVLSAICRELDIDRKEMNAKEFEGEKYTKSNIGI
jgi:hypothetical protein